MKSALHKVYAMQKLCLKTVFLLCFFFFAFTANAAHFRSGTISWRPISGNTVEFKVSQSYGGWAFGSGYTLGSTQVMDYLYLGNGASVPIPLVITSINAAEGWWYGEATFQYTYPNTGNYTAYFASCCRISNLSNNNDQSWRNETVVNVGTGNSSPVSTIAATVNLPASLTNASFQIPSFDPDGDALNFRLATSAEMGGGSNPSGLTINSSTGVVNFNTIGKAVGSLWNVAFTISDGKTRVTVDFIIKITQNSTPPVFDYLVTPVNGRVYQGAPGQTISFPIRAYDNDAGNVVTLSAVGLPPGATTTPALPTNGNPVASTFSWTPNANQYGTFVINFTATDNIGVQTTTSVTISISLKPVFVAPTPANNSETYIETGSTYTATVRASDPDPNDVVRITAISNMPAGFGISSVLPTNAANPVNLNLSWTPTPSAFGQHSVTFTATDSYNDQTTHTLNYIVNTKPVFGSTPATTAYVGQTYTYNIVGIDPDVQYGDVLQLIGGNIPSWLTFTNNGNGSGTLSGTPTLANLGSHPVGLKLEDTYHHDYSPITTQNFSIEVSGIAPSIVVPSTITVNAPANACDASVAFAATETIGIPASTITYTVNGQPVVSGATFPVGTTTVTATATNAVGASSATFDVVVKDVTAPTIAASTNLNAIATSAAGAVVNYTLPTATDNCSGVVSVVATPASGSTFPIGTSTVTVVATDAVGNESISSFTVTVVGVAPSIVVPATIGVDASTTNCGAAVNFAATETTGIPASTITYTVNGQPVVSGATFPLGTTTVTATATNAVGSSSATFDIVVTDNTAPEISTPAAQVFCENTAGTYSLQAVSASDNCGIATVSFAISGATTRTGSGYEAGTAFNVGTSTITYTVTDVNGNISTKTLVVTVNKAPTATISTSNPDAFCNKLTVIGNSTSPITGYAWTYNGNAFAGTQAISLDNTNGDGTYSLLVTDNKGCISLAAVTYQYSKQNTISNYTILAYKEAELKEYNTVQTGSVGVMSKKGEAEIGKNSSVAAPGAFVKAPKIEVKQGANVPVRLVGVASVSLPTMQYNSANTSSLPNYTTNAGATISLSGNYKNLKIRKGSNVVLSGTTFGNIDIEEGSVVRFTSTVINIEHLKVGKGPNNGLTQVRFANNTSVRVSKHVQIEEDCFINPDANQVTFYLGRQSNHDCNKHKNNDGDDDDHDRGHGDGDQKFEVKGGNTTVIANVYAPTGDIKVKGGEGCHKNHSSTTVRMTGLFIGYEVEGDGRNIIWNNYACGSASPIAAADAQPVYNKTAELQEVADDLKVTVMPNPSTTYFTLKLASKSELPVNIKVVDAAGRVIDAKAKQPANSTIQMGQSYMPGSYFAEFIQGNQRKVVQLIKIK